MPYNRRYTRRPMRRRRRPMRRRTNYRKPMTSGRVKRIISAELKVRDLGVGPIGFPNATGVVTNITSGIAQGDANNQRNGNWIKPVSFMGTLTLVGNPASLLEVQQFRVGVFCWKENEDVDPATLPKLMEDTFAPHQGYNITSKGSFKILWSRTGILSTAIGNPQHQKVLKFYVKPRMKVLYDAATPRKYQLFIFACSDIAAASDPPVLSFDTRLRYTDS